MVTPAPEKPWEISGEQLVILKNAVCKGATDQELQYCLTVARRYRLDPFRQQIWFVPRWDSGAMNAAGGKGAMVWTPQVGINGLLYAAARDHHQEFGSVSLPEYGPMLTVEGGVKAPEWAKVKVLKKGADMPTEAICYWEEYAPDVAAKTDKGWKHPFWRKMPRRMLAKCATALAVREAYPDLGGLYIPEEMEKMAEGAYTESGRQIVENVPHNGSHEAAQAVAARKIREARQGKPIASTPIEPEIGPENPVSAPAMATPQPAADRKPLGTVEIDHTDEARPIVRGDISDIGPSIREACPSFAWDAKVSWWRINAGDVERLRQLCRKLGYASKEIVPKPKPKQGGGAKAQTTTDAVTDGGAAKENAASPVEVTGVIEQSSAQEGKNPRVSVLLRMGKASHWMATFDKKHFQFLLQAPKGSKATFFVTKRTSGENTFTTIVGLKQVGNTEFSEDGKTPCISVDREPGGRTLF